MAAVRQWMRQLRRLTDYACQPGEGMRIICMRMSRIQRRSPSCNDSDDLWNRLRGDWCRSAYRPCEADKGIAATPCIPGACIGRSKYLKTASKKVIGQTAIDALGHMIESYLNTTATDYSRMFVDQGLKVWARSKDAYLV